MDSRAKQRLTGAVILVALFVLLVPELLTGPDDSRPAGNPAAEDEGLREYTIDIDGQDRAAQPAAPPAQPPAVNLPAVEAAGPAESTRAPPGEAAVPAPAPAATPAAANPMASTGAAPTAPAAPASAPSPQQKPVSGNFVVQLGSFGSRDNADRLVRDMKAKGFSA